MKLLKLLLFIVVVILLPGCVELYGPQSPAPVFGGSSGDIEPYPPMPENLPQPQPPEPPVTETRPLENYGKAPEIIEMKPELPPPQAPTMPPLPPEMPSDQPTTTDPFAAEQPDGTAPPEVQSPTEEQAKPEEQPAQAAPPAPEVPKEPEQLEPLETFAPQSPAVGSLVMAANEESQSGKLDSAVSTIERAIRIEPRNATLYYKLALLRLQQSKPRLAEDLARKAALLAVNDTNLKKHSWLLVANAREQQNNIESANKAKAEANKY